MVRKTNNLLHLIAVALLGACAQGQFPQVPERSTGGTSSATDGKACAHATNEFPANTLRPGERAHTMLEATIGPDGTLERTAVVESSGHVRLDELAVKKLSSCSFRPGRDKEGNPVRASFKVEYVWQAQ